MSESAHDKSSSLHDIAEEVEREREERGHSVLDGQPVVGNEPDTSEGADTGIVEDILVVPPARPSGN